MCRQFFFATCCIFITLSVVRFSFAVQTEVPLEKAHAHNDYNHPRPLLDALDNGFCSVEADIFLMDGELRVGHDFRELKPGRTLEKLYLDPLRERLNQNGGELFKGSRVPFTLLIDIKTKGKEVYPVLRRSLEKYKDMLATNDAGSLTGAIQVVISGDRPVDLIENDPAGLMGIDGRLSDLDSNRPAHLMPLISDRWGKHFRWKGEGEFPEAERDKLKSIVEKAHEKGRRVRFWATPERPELWQQLLEANVDHINTDRLVELREFLSDGKLNTTSNVPPPKPDLLREFWPNYSLPGNAALLPGNRRVFVPDLKKRFEIAKPVPEMHGRNATGHLEDLLGQPLPTGDFTLELLLLHHVNRPVYAALYSFATDPSRPEFLLTYKSEHDRGPVQVNLDVDGLSGAGGLEHKSNGSLAFKKYWYHIVVVRHGDQLEMAVNGKNISGQLGADKTSTKPAAGEVNCQLDLAIYAEKEPLLRPSNVVKWVKVHKRPLYQEEISAAFGAAKVQVEKGIKYPALFHFNAGPYLNFATQTSVNVLWETNFPATAEVHYGTTRELGSKVIVDQISEKSVAEKLAFIQETRIEGLAPDTQYFYNVKVKSLDGQAMESGVSTFKTAVRDDQDYMFAAIGDTETRPHINDAIAKQIWSERPNFVIHLGDLTDGGKEDHKWQWNFEYFAGLNQLHSRIPVFPVAGNGEGDLFWYQRYHVLPGREAYYKFTYGNAEFFMLNSNRRDDQFLPGGEQYKWLDEELAKSKARWKFAALHHAPYSTDENDYGDTWKQSRGDQGDLKVRPLVPLFEKHGVDIVFFGHLHSYSRIGPIRDNLINRAKGVTYIQTGGAGGNLEDFAPTKTWFSQKLYAGHHYCLINVSDDRLFFKMYDLKGNLRDYHEMRQNEE